jgi:tRNA threonylcarbamoyl adenosine modification protein (Sua5/YciO/YrdC/YwlC family)
MTHTKVIKEDPEHPKDHPLIDAAHIIKKGGLVIIPTETVYGIAANMLDDAAIKRLVELKGRPADKPFSLHIADKSKVEDFALRISLGAYKLIDKFWPGPLTLVFQSIKGGTIGIRMPDDLIALSVIKHAEVPVVCPSANISGKESPKNFQEAVKDLDGKVDLAIDGGPTRLQAESSVVDVSKGELKILREGALKKEDIEKAFNTKQVLFICTGNSCRSVMAEMMLRKVLKEKNKSGIEVSSAGTMMLTGIGVSSGSREVLAREGLDASGHFSQRLTKEMARRSDLILVMERMHEEAVLRVAPDVKNRLFLLKEFAKIDDRDLNIPDPIGRSQDFYDKVGAVIKEAVERVSNIL